MSRTRTIALALALAAAAVAGGCAGNDGAVRPVTPSSPSTPGTSATSAPSAAPSGSASGAGATTAAPLATSPPTVLPKGPPMKPIVPSTMDGKLREIGLDPKALPPLAKLEPDKLRAVMNTFTKALGVPCRHCHESDFRTPTAKKKIATRMWNDFVRGLAMEDGATLYCDSCHQSRAVLLDRSDGPALEAWMTENMVAKLHRADGQEHACKTCHGDPFVPKIFTRLWR